ncbi:hypothetical protein PFZ49_04730 [Microbacterium lacticum]|uniref:hypothetical protein n=1 Tax=Microbacterium lacticum TaxID=33885 RepID=UPI003A8559AB
MHGVADGGYRGRGRGPAGGQFHAALSGEILLIINAVAAEDSWQDPTRKSVLLVHRHEVPKGRFELFN